MTTTAVRHPLFARCFVRLSRLMEREAGAHRRQMLAGATGRVLEIGAGNGMNFRHYPPTVNAVVALEPEPYLRARAQEAARDAPVPVTVRDAVADELPFEDEHFDTAVSQRARHRRCDQDRGLPRRAHRPRQPRARVGSDEPAHDRSGDVSIAVGQPIEPEPQPDG